MTRPTSLRDISRYPFLDYLMIRRIPTVLSRLALAVVLALAAAPLGAQATSDSAAVAATVSAYHRALETGDSSAALALLAPDAVVLESGGVEPREEYRAHHLAADIEFARGVPATRSLIRVMVAGDAGWASSTTSSKGTFRGRAIDSAGAELMVLSRGADGQWRIRAIHWSSRNRRPAAR